MMAELANEIARNCLQPTKELEAAWFSVKQSKEN